MHKPSTFRV